MRKILTHPAVLLLSRLVLGGVFIYASLDKIAHPADFAKAVALYRVTQSALLVNLAAVTLPWVELLVGGLLLMGLWFREDRPESAGQNGLARLHARFCTLTQRGALGLSAGLLVFFLILLGVTLARGIDINCGCFTTAESSRVGWLTLLRDSLFLLPSLPLFLSWRKRVESQA